MRRRGHPPQQVTKKEIELVLCTLLMATWGQDQEEGEGGGRSDSGGGPTYSVEKNTAIVFIVFD